MQRALPSRGDTSELDVIRRRALEMRAEAAEVGESLWPMRLAALLLVTTVLFLLIGPEPYSRQITLDPETNGAVLSPLHRYGWLVLTVMAAPVLWSRRGEMIETTKRMWPLLLLLGWFAATTVWALDPETSRRRLWLLLFQVIICAACALGLRRAEALHRTLAASCAIIVLIDLASWIFLPGLSQTDLGLAAIHNHKNTLGMAMMFAEFVCAPFVFAQTTWRGRLFWSFIVVSGAALLFASQSKTSLNITLAAFLTTPPLLAVLGARKRVLVSVLASALALLTAAALGWLCLSYVRGHDPLEPFRGVTFTQRTDVWQFVTSQIALRPMTGAGFLSFWDINPLIQPSLQTDYWFAQADSPTNEAHDGYLDLLVTTGFIGLALALFVLLRWLARGLSLLRGALRSRTAGAAAGLPYLTFLGLFPILIALHNLLESSYFNTVGLFSFMVMFMGIDVDLRFPLAPVSARPRLPARDRAPAAA